MKVIAPTFRCKCVYECARSHGWVCGTGGGLETDLAQLREVLSYNVEQIRFLHTSGEFEFKKKDHFSCILRGLISKSKLVCVKFGLRRN